MAPSTAAPQTYKQPSRKGKKAWRKNVDLTQVETGLDTVRDEVIKTGGIIAEKPSAELFTVDTTGSEEIRKKVAKISKPLKAEQIIAQRSKVPAVDSRKRPAPGTTNGIIVERSAKKRKPDYVSRKELERLRQRAYGGDSVEKELVDSGRTVEEDPWEHQKALEDPRFSFLPKKKATVAPKTLREAPISLLESGKPMPAVTKPKAAISYNPDFKDWDELLTEEGNREVEAERKRLQEAREEQERQAKIEAAQVEAERSEYYTEDESVWEGVESEYEGSDLKKKRPERKTPAERNKVKRRKAAEREARHQARMTERLNRVASQKQKQDVAISKRDSKQLEVAESEPQHSSDEEIDDRKLRRRKFGTMAIPEKPLEVVLPDELQDSLRMLKPEGNVLRDRFRNLLMAGKIETRRAGFQAKKKRTKLTEKWTSKDFVVPGLI